MTARPILALSVAPLVAIAATVGSALGFTGRSTTAGCPADVLSRSYVDRVARVAAAGRDVWGEAELHAAGGPSLNGAGRYLRPLLFAGHVPGKPAVPLTDSGVYYLPFAVPQSVSAPGQVALHLADGSEIVAGRVGGRKLVVSVGIAGAERYGSCIARLSTPALYGGYLPVLETRYRDAAGAIYRQESFAARVPEAGGLLSFARVVVDARRASAAVEIRFTLSDQGLRPSGGRLVRAGNTYLLYSPAARADASSVTYRVPRGSTRTVAVAWPNAPTAVGPLSLDADAYLQARARTVAYWHTRLSRGATYQVPERQVMDAERATLIQNLVMGWRYSIGNAYEGFEYPESLDAAAVMGEYGFSDIERATLQTSLEHHPSSLYPDWEMGAKLLALASYTRLSDDATLLTGATSTLRGYLASFTVQLADNHRGILQPEQWASDLPERTYALDNQAVVWHGLRVIAAAWSALGDTALARRARALATRLGQGLETAIQRSQRPLPDHTLYLPVRLYTEEPAPSSVLATRRDSYWNLVIPYVLASGLLPADSPHASAALRYLEHHGSLLLGQIRMNAYSLRTGTSVPTGTDDVYLLDLARFLADNHQADRLDLTLYGQLATGMTPGTHISGEAASITPADGRTDRTMYLPPNSVANAAFLETLRLTLVHELAAPDGTPAGLELAYATPRRWLSPGRTIAVHEALTSFGRLSYTITTRAHRAYIALDIPSAHTLRVLSLRLRLPGGKPLTRVELNGAPYTRVEGAAETIDLSGRHGQMTLTADY
jgi:hypothetical protein